MYERPYDQPQGIGSQMTGQQGIGQQGSQHMGMGQSGMMQPGTMQAGMMQPGMMQGSNVNTNQMTQRLSEERVQKEFLAQRLSREAMSQWQKAIEGLVALPTALTLGWASAAMYMVSFLTRGFEVFTVISEDMRRNDVNSQFQMGQQGQYGFQGQQQPTQFGVQAGGFSAQYQPGQFHAQYQPGQFGAQYQSGQFGAQGEFGHEATGWRPGNFGERPLGERGNENSDITAPITPTTPRA
ncbi:MAG TPA: hypothetical protein VH877_10060 [Polyangia bacterium]|jgi:hypothetical protein|nr:hypothetical protein [Polyangia bacterium]